jgi:hypothetical protein
MQHIVEKSIGIKKEKEKPIIKVEKIRARI